MLLDTEDGVDGQHQAGRHEDRAGGVCALPDADSGAALDEAHGEERRHDPDRNVHEEDPVPVDEVREDAACEQPDRAAGRGHEAEHADRLCLLPRLGEHHDDHPERHRRCRRAAGTLDEAGRDQHLLALRKGAQKRGGREHAQPGQEYASMTEQVSEAPCQQQQAAEGDQIGVDHPGEVVLGEVEVVLDRGERDVHDGRVEHDHQDARA